MARMLWFVFRWTFSKPSFVFYPSKFKTYTLEENSAWFVWILSVLSNVRVWMHAAAAVAILGNQISMSHLSCTRSVHVWRQCWISTITLRRMNLKCIVRMTMNQAVVFSAHLPIEMFGLKKQFKSIRFIRQPHIWGIKCHEERRQLVRLPIATVIHSCMFFFCCDWEQW